jgi:hypothetical protein
MGLTINLLVSCSFFFNSEIDRFAAHVLRNHRDQRYGPQ